MRARIQSTALNHSQVDLSSLENTIIGNLFSEKIFLLFVNIFCLKQPTVVGTFYATYTAAGYLYFFIIFSLNIEIKKLINRTKNFNMKFLWNFSF